MISIIIPTYNRREELKELLCSLKQQDFRADFEVIIVDDGSTDGTGEVVAEIAPKWNGRLSYFGQENKGPGTARNLGIQQAKGDILVFTDTDCLAPSGWLKELTIPLSDESVGAVGGPEQTCPDDSLLLKCFSYVMTSFLTTGGIRGRKGKKLAKYYPRSFNMAVSRKAMRMVGGFREMFYGEDILLSHEIKQAGFRLQYAQDAVVYHRRRTTLKQFFGQLFRMGQARMIISFIHRSLLQPLYVLPAVAILFFVALISFSFVSPVALEMTKIFITVCMFFLFVVGISSAIRLRNAQAFFVVPVLFVLQQLAYGLGFLHAICRNASTFRRGFVGIFKNHETSI